MGAWEIMVNMRLVLDPRAWRILRRIPRSSIFSAAELFLIFLIAMETARLIWAIVTPVDPLGGWIESRGRAQAPSTTILRTFDPFFRNGAAGSSPAVVTSLNLKLFGIRSDQVSGRGSAIIGLPDGTQSSYGIGEEILPGVTLAEVATDSVTISRGGAREQLFLEQGQSAPAEAGALSSSMPPSPPSAEPAGDVQPGPSSGGTDALLTDLQSSPQTENGKIVGVSVTPRSSRGPFSMSGLQPGDVIISVGGQPIAGDNLQTVLGQAIARGQAVPLQVRRGGTTTVVQLRATP
jgi:general secretion pathway protein C